MRMKIFFILVITLLLPSLVGAKVFVVGESENIFAQLLKQRKCSYAVVATIDDALAYAKRGDGIVVTAPEYPDKMAEISSTTYKAVEDNALHLFVEYPNELPSSTGDKALQSFTAHLEHGIITSPAMGIEPMSIVGINGCKLVKTQSEKPLMVLGKVAGLRVGLVPQRVLLARRPATGMSPKIWI